MGLASRRGASRLPGDLDRAQEPPLVAPSETKPVTIVTTGQFLAIIFGVAGVIFGGFCLYGLADQILHPSDVNIGAAAALIGPVLNLPIGLVTLVTGLKARKGSPGIGWFCILIGLANLAVPISVVLVLHY